MAKLEDKLNRFTKAHPKGWRILKIVVVVFWAVIIIACIAGGSSDSETTESEMVEGTNISQHAAEVACQDAQVTGTSQGYTVINVLNYNLQFWSAGPYDKDGNPISFAQWNGKDPDGETVRYTCYFSGSGDDNINIIYVKAGSVDVWKSWSDYEWAQYDSDGNHIMTESWDEEETTEEE